MKKKKTSLPTRTVRKALQRLIDQTKDKSKTERYMSGAITPSYKARLKGNKQVIERERKIRPKLYEEPKTKQYGITKGSK